MALAVETQTEQQTSPVRLTPDQRRRFEEDGFLVVRDALPPEMVERLAAAVDRLYEAGKREKGVAKTGKWDMRNCIVHDDVFLELLDWQATFPLVVDIFGWNLQLLTSHVIVREPSPPDADAFWKAEGWHRDGGTSAQEMMEPHPRLSLKIAYWLTDLSEPGRGNIRVIPGSHRLTGRPAWGEGMPDPYGAIEILAKPGDALLFEQRTWHAVGSNQSESARKSVFMGYSYRWLRPIDWVTMPPELIEKANPIQRQLLGHLATPLGFYLPTDDDAPLRRWLSERTTT